MVQEQREYAAQRSRKVKRKWPKFFGSIAQLNRWTNKPHKHEREIARRTSRGW